MRGLPLVAGLLTLALLAPAVPAGPGTAEVLPLTWTSRHPLPTERVDIGVAHYNDHFFVAGGNAPGSNDFGTRFDWFDLRSQAWLHEGPALPVAVHHAAVTAVGPVVFVLGGLMKLPDGTEVPTPLTWSIDTSLPPDQQRWLPFAPLPFAVYGAAVATDGFTRVWVAGGFDDRGVPVASAWEMRAQQGTPTGAWTPLPDLSLPRGHAAAIPYGNGEVWVVGGTDEVLSAKDRVDILDLATGTWHQGPPLPEPRWGLGLAWLSGGLYALGGRDGPFPLANVTQFETETGQWVEREPMPRAGWGMAAAQYLDDAYLIGGRDDVSAPTGEVWRMHVETNLP